MLPFCLLLVAAALLPCQSPQPIVQQGRAFLVSEVRVRRGETLRFLNRDEFDHQIYVASPTFTFESDEAEPGAEVDVTLTEAGTFPVRCHIHPRMHLTVVVD